MQLHNIIYCWGYELCDDCCVFVWANNCDGFNEEGSWDPLEKTVDAVIGVFWKGKMVLFWRKVSSLYGEEFAWRRYYKTKVQLSP